MLLRPMVPYDPDAPAKLDRVPIFISAGVSDPFGHPQEIQRLEAILKAGGARVTTHQERAGHQLMPGDFASTAAWLRSHFGPPAK